MPGWRQLAGLAAALCTLLAAPVVQAHIVVGERTLHGLFSEADLVLRARITSVDAGPPQAGESGRPGVEALVLEVFKGDFEAERVRFAQHGHGVARFETGDETLLFLLAIERSRELAELGRSGAFEWVSFQEHDDEYPLSVATRGPLLQAVSAYVAADAESAPGPRLAALRRANLALLTSRDPALAASALRDLVVATGVPLLTEQELPALEEVLDDPGSSMGVRVALLAELQRRGLLKGPERWLTLLSDATPPRDRITAIRAAGQVAAPPVRVRLIELVGDDDPEVAAAAAAAVGTPGNSAAVAPLAAALSGESPKLRMAAIRGLGAVATPEAQGVLGEAAESHPDPATRRRAGAELSKRGQARR